MAILVNAMHMGTYPGPSVLSTKIHKHTSVYMRPRDENTALANRQKDDVHERIQTEAEPYPRLVGHNTRSKCSKQNQDRFQEVLPSGSGSVFIRCANEDQPESNA